VHRLVALVGPAQASRLLFGAGAIDGQEAERIGLVEQFAEAAAMEAEAYARPLPRTIR
jgi:enoyl-CoA hydratase/carnithine racemase